MSSPNKIYEIVLSDKVLSMSEKHYFLKFPESSQEDICVRNQCLETLLKHLLPRRVFPEKYFSKQLFLKRTYQCLWVILFTIFLQCLFIFSKAYIVYRIVYNIVYYFPILCLCIVSSDEWWFVFQLCFSENQILDFILHFEPETRNIWQ